MCGEPGLLRLHCECATLFSCFPVLLSKLTASAMKPCRESF